VLLLARSRSKQSRIAAPATVGTGGLLLGRRVQQDGGSHQLTDRPERLAPQLLPHAPQDMSDARS
jgi:hypothetical protein